MRGDGTSGFREVMSFDPFERVWSAADLSKVLAPAEGLQSSHGGSYRRTRAFYFIERGQT